MDKTIKTTAYYHLLGLGRYCNALKAEILFLIHEVVLRVVYEQR